MNDKDIIERAAALMSTKVSGPYGQGRGGNPSAQPYYRAAKGGDHAAVLMKMLRPLMGERRGAKIDEVLALHGTLINP